LDEVIERHAKTFAAQLNEVAERAKKEEEIRITVERLLERVRMDLKSFLPSDTDLDLQGKHEFTVIKGRADSVYGRVIIEYKHPNSSARIGPERTSPGTEKLIQQLISRLHDLELQVGHELHSMFGVGLDGRRVVFVSYRNGGWTIDGPKLLNEGNVRRFLWALFNLGAKGSRAFTPEELAEDFGGTSVSHIARDTVTLFYEVLLKITRTSHPKVHVLFEQWKILFGEVCGYDVSSSSQKFVELAESYGIPTKKLRPAELLFALHTYYALFMKLVAVEITTLFPSRLTSTIHRFADAATNMKLKELFEDLEDGGLFAKAGITNFLEGDLFLWYLDAWSDFPGIEVQLRKLVKQLAEYNPATLAENPEESRDLLKKLYHELFPKRLRHDLGEYYTPDWLADHVLDGLHYTGNTHQRVLDPACGSGTFLIMTIARIRKSEDAKPPDQRMSSGELLNFILKSVVGFDLNPLAVLAARTNYLLAIRGLIASVAAVEIPVYLCDSVVTPSVYGGLFAGLAPSLDEKPRELPTAAGVFFIPNEIAHDRQKLGIYATVLEHALRDKLTASDFLHRLEAEGLPRSQQALHSQLYKQLQLLKRQRRNGIWARIIKNAFAPLFCGEFDLIVGNPPWIRWGYLPDNYRHQTKDLWINYGLFSLKGFEARLGAGEKDFSQLFTYVCIDVYLKHGGRLGFLITTALLRTRGQSEGFRRFQLGESGERFAVLSVDDFSSINPFEGASNLTAAIFFQKGRATSYPVEYTMWVPNKGEGKTTPSNLVPVRNLASPSDPRSPISQWKVVSPEQSESITRLIGHSDYKALNGARTDPYGVYQLNCIQRVSPRTLLIENCSTAGKRAIRPVTTVIEDDFIYPLVRGKDVLQWISRPEVYALMVQDPETRKGMSEAILKIKYPLTFAYLLQFKEELEARQSGAIRALMERGPFYSMFAVSRSTYSPYKVAWRRMGNRFQACLLSTHADTFLGTKLAIPSDTVAFVPFNEETEALYFLGMIQSAVIQSIIYAVSVGGRGLGSPSLLNVLPIPSPRKVGTAIVESIAKLSRQMIRLLSGKSDEGGSTVQVLAELDDITGQHFGCSRDEVVALRHGVAEKEQQKARGKLKDRSVSELVGDVLDIIEV
jgi:hypothetical protein